MILNIPYNQYINRQLLCCKTCLPMVSIGSFYVDWNSGEGFLVDQLGGKTLKIGDTLELMAVERDQRCKFITIYPETAEGKLRLLRHVNKQHGCCTGVYACVLK